MSNGCPEPGSTHEELAQMVTGPRRTSVDGVEYQARSAQDMIALDRYVRSSCAYKYGFCSLVAQQAVPPNGLGVSLGWMGPQETRRIW